MPPRYPCARPAATQLVAFTLTRVPFVPGRLPRPLPVDSFASSDQCIPQRGHPHARIQMHRSLQAHRFNARTVTSVAETAETAQGSSLFGTAYKMPTGCQAPRAVRLMLQYAF